ncbi:hypothetical protein GQ53DRAFT_809864 [Thozetella sp. PMI_491]|nr:hypothetical protein GQ53DRAFT_809864 [Thozetella sp. PMI_491]
MAYQPFNISGEGHPKAIYLYTTPLKYQRNIFKLRKPVDIFAHWAIAVQGTCYELTRNDPKQKPKYLMRVREEQEWLRLKYAEDRLCENKFVGYTHLSVQKIYDVAHLVWQKSLQGKYIYDEQNCQVFIRLLVELIGDPATRANFPQFFDSWSKAAGISRDVSFLSIAMGASALAATLVAASVDVTGTAAAGAALSTSMVIRSSTALLTSRYVKKKLIEKGQEEIRANLNLDRNILEPYPPILVVGRYPDPLANLMTRDLVISLALVSD